MFSLLGTREPTVALYRLVALPFLAILAALLLPASGAQAAPNLTSASSAGRLVLTTSGLPSGEQATVALHGAGIRREIKVGRKQMVRLPAGRYSLDVRRVVTARAHRGVQQGAVAYPAKKKISVAVEQGASMKLVVRYAVVNAGVQPLPKRVLGFKGDPSDPTAVLLPGHAGLPRPGTIFVSGPTPALPRGLISKVTAVHEHLGKVVASLVAVPVSDAVPSLDFVGNLSLTAINGGAAETQSDRRSSSFTARRRQVAPSVAHQSSGCRPPSLVKFGAHLDSVELRQASIGAWPPQMRLTLAVRSTESLGVAAAAVGINCDWTLAELGPYQAAIPVGPIVIPVYATLPVNAGIHINGRLDVGTVNIASTTVATAAAGVDETKASLSQQGSNVWMSGSPSISGSAKLSASIGVQAGIGVAKGANVHLEADFGPEFDWSSGHSCDLLLNLGSLSAGVTVLGRNFSTPSFTPLHPQIWSGCQSASGGGGSTPGGGGGGGGSGPPGGGETPGGGEETPSGSSEYRVMIATLSGGTWSAVAVPRSIQGPEEAAGAHDPACTASGTCVVASGYYVSGTPHGWLNTYTGGGWGTEEAPLPVGGPPEVGEELGEPACAANPVCVVPGSYHQGYGMIETLAGGHWSAITAPIPSSGLPNGGVVDFWSPACSSTGICVVTGEFVDSGFQEHDMIETLSGGTWTSTEAPVPSGGVAGSARLQGNVACGSGESCFIAGSYEGSDGETHGMLENLKAGTWTAIQVPIPAGAVPGSGTVDQPACSWSGLCVTLGDYRAAGEEEGMIDRFVGGAWSSADLALPEDGVAGSGRRGTPTCSATGTCAIAGEYQPEAGGYPAAMIDIVTDSSSTVIGLPSGGYGWPNSGVSEPACASADSCVVVSERHNFNDLVYNWIESSSGGVWSSIEPPVPPGSLSGSGGISGNPACSSDGTCVLPGGYNGPGGGGMIAVRPAAGDWTAVPAPTPPGGLKGSGSFELHNRPACSSAGLCVLVGGYQVSSGGGAE